MKHPNDSNCLNEMRLHNAAVGDVSRFFMQAGGKQLLHLRKAQRRNVLASKKVSRTQTLRPPPLRLRQTLVGRRLPCITQWFGLSQGWSYEFMTDAWHDLCKPLQPHVASISFLLIYFLFTSFMTCNIIHLPFPCNAKQPVTTPPFVSMKKRGGKTFPVTESMLMPWWRLKQREGDTWNRGKTEAPSTHGSQVQSFSETLGTICTSGKSWKTMIACGNFTTSFKSSTPLSPKIAWNILKRKGPKPLIFEDWILQSDSCCNSQPLIRSPYIYKSDCRLPIFCHPNPFKVGT